LITEEMITFEDIINDPELQKRIIFEVLNDSFEKSVKNIIGYVQKHYKLDLDSTERMQLRSIFVNNLLKMKKNGLVIKKEKGYILSRYNRVSHIFSDY